ncbi:MAG: hypothetical protein ACK5A0_06015 [Polaromonas sp.]
MTALLTSVLTARRRVSHHRLVGRTRIGLTGFVAELAGTTALKGVSINSILADTFDTAQLVPF